MEFMYYHYSPLGHTHLSKSNDCQIQLYFTNYGNLFFISFSQLKLLERVKPHKYDSSDCLLKSSKKGT